MLGPSGQRTGVPVLHRTVTISKTVFGRPTPTPTPGHGTEVRLKHNLSLPVKRTYFLNLELHPEGQAFGFPHVLEANEELPGNESRETPS